jgi:hypothetical protein
MDLQEEDRKNEGVKRRRMRKRTTKYLIIYK